MGAGRSAKGAIVTTSKGPVPLPPATLVSSSLRLPAAKSLLSRGLFACRMVKSNASLVKPLSPARRHELALGVMLGVQQWARMPEKGRKLTLVPMLLMFQLLPV